MISVLKGKKLKAVRPSNPFPRNPQRFHQCASLFLLVLAESPATLHSLAPAAMAYDHPDAPQQFSVRLPNETMGLVTQIQGFRRRINQPTTLSAIVEDAIDLYYARLVEEGAIEDDDLL